MKKNYGGWIIGFSLAIASFFAVSVLHTTVAHADIGSPSCFLAEQDVFASGLQSPNALAVCGNSFYPGQCTLPNGISTIYNEQPTYNTVWFLDEGTQTLLPTEYYCVATSFNGNAPSTLWQNLGNGINQSTNIEEIQGSSQVNAIGNIWVANSDGGYEAQGGFTETEQTCSINLGQGSIDSYYPGPSCAPGGCLTDADCTAGETCNTNTDTCQAPTSTSPTVCESNADCSSGYSCDLSNGTCVPSSSNPTPTSTNPTPSPSFTISLAPQVVSIYPGQTATATVSIASVNGYVGNVTLADGSPLTTGMASTFSPSNTVSLTANQTVTATYIISTSYNTPSGSYSLSVEGSGTATSSTSGYVTVNVLAPTPTLNISPASASTTIGGSYQFTAWYDPDGPSGPQPQQNVTQNVKTWSSSNSSIATVGQGASGGTVQGVGTGAAIITATYQGVTATANLNVFSASNPDFSINVTPSDQSVNQPSSGSTTIAVYQVSISPINGFSSPISLDVNNLPSGVNGSFNNSSITPGQTATLTLQVSSAAGIGESTFTVVSTSGSTVHSQTADVNVQQGQQGSGPVTGVTVNCTPTSISTTQTSQCNATVSGGNGSGVTWTVISGGGSISSTGVYTPPAGGGVTVVVQATSVQNSSESGAQSITVTSSGSTNPISVVVAPSTTVSPGTTVTVTASGGNGSYTWSTPGLTGVTESGPGNDTITGSYSGNGSYPITVTDSSSDHASTNITVVQPACTFGANPTDIVPPEQSTLSWACTGTTNCSITGEGTVNPNSGTLEVAPTANTQYTLTCIGGGSGPANIFNSSVMVTVSNPTLRETNP